jgi:hypothetical protein
MKSTEPAQYLIQLITSHWSLVSCILGLNNISFANLILILAISSLLNRENKDDLGEVQCSRNIIV